MPKQGQGDSMTPISAMLTSAGGATDKTLKAAQLAYYWNLRNMAQKWVGTKEGDYYQGMLDQIHREISESAPSDAQLKDAHPWAQAIGSSGPAFAGGLMLGSSALLTNLVRQALSSTSAGQKAANVPISDLFRGYGR